MCTEHKGTNIANTTVLSVADIKNGGAEVQLEVSEHKIRIFF